MTEHLDLEQVSNQNLVYSFMEELQQLDTGVAPKDRCIIKKWIDEGLIQDRYKCYLTDDACFCETSIGCYWRR